MKEADNENGNSCPTTIRSFKVSKALVVPVTKHKKCRSLDNLKAIKETLTKVCPEFCSSRGCYIFAIRNGKGSTPIYVGRTRKQTLLKEAFSPDKCNKINVALMDCLKGTLTITFLASEALGKNVPQTVINELEEWLIKKAYRRNRNLINIRGRGVLRWAIDGVVRSGKGAPTNESKALKRLLGLR